MFVGTVGSVSEYGRKGVVEGQGREPTRPGAIWQMMRFGGQRSDAMHYSAVFLSSPLWCRRVRESQQWKWEKGQERIKRKKMPFDVTEQISTFCHPPTPRLLSPFTNRLIPSPI